MKQQTSMWLTIGGFVVLWAALSLSSPGRTLHLAPVIIAGAPVIGATMHLPSTSKWNRGRLTVIGGGLALATTAVLAAAGGLEGPSLLPAGGAALEAYAFAATSAVLAWGISGVIARRGEQK